MMAATSLIPVGTILRVTADGLVVVGSAPPIGEDTSPATVTVTSGGVMNADFVKEGEYYPDDHVVWQRCSNGSRAHGLSCADPDVALQGLQLWASSAREAAKFLAREPGVPVSWRALAAELELDGSRAVAGMLNGFSKAHDERGIAFPFTWWEREGADTLYAIAPSVAEGINTALSRFADPIAFKSDRWFAEVVPAATEHLIVRAVEGQGAISYSDLATWVKTNVPGARVAARGKVMGELLGDVCRTQDEIERLIGGELPMLTALVTRAGGKPGAGFSRMVEERGRRLEGETEEEAWSRMVREMGAAWRSIEIPDPVPVLAE